MQAWFCTGELMKQIEKSYQRKMEEGSYDTDTKKVHYASQQGHLIVESLVL